MKTSSIKELRSSWGHGLLLLQQVYKPILKRNHVTPAEKRILYGLDKHGPMSKQDLARAIVLGPSAVTRAMQRLEAQHEIKRKIDLNDRRFIQLELTVKGKKKIDSIQKQALLVFEQACAGISQKNIIFLHQSLESINNHLTEIIGEIS